MISCTCSGDMLAITFESGLLAGAAAPLVGAAFAGAAAGFSAAGAADSFPPPLDLQPTIPELNTSPVTATPAARTFVNRITIPPPPGDFRSGSDGADCTGRGRSVSHWDAGLHMLAGN